MEERILNKFEDILKEIESKSLEPKENIKTLILLMSIREELLIKLFDKLFKDGVKMTDNNRESIDLIRTLRKESKIDKMKFEEIEDWILDLYGE